MPLSIEQLELRRTKITATDATAIVGVNPWRTALDVYVDKVEGSSFMGNMATRIGDRAEALIMDLLAEECGLVLAPATTEVHPICGWAAATPDRLVLAEPGGPRVGVAEAKCVGFRQAAQWGDSGDLDDVPDYVLVQVQWQMICTRTRKAHVAALLGTELRVYEVAHDEDLALSLLEACDEFRRTHWEARIPPPATTPEATAAIARLYPRCKGVMAQADDAAEWAAEKYLRARAARMSAEAEEEAAKASLMAAIGEREGIEGVGWRATWKAPKGGMTEWKAVAEELGAPAELIAKHTKPHARRFLLKGTR
jgi:putative phage-type endonuclease